MHSVGAVQGLENWRAEGYFACCQWVLAGADQAFAVALSAAGC